MKRYDYAVQRLLSSLLFYGWACRSSVEAPSPGDLVMLTSAPDSDWHLSIYRESDGKPSFSEGHLLESLKTGALMWWSNVGFNVIDRKKCHVGREAEWTDEQFAFADKFHKVWRKADFYINLPFIDRIDSEEVVIKFRTRYSLDDRITELPPLAWRKVTQKRLLQVLLDGERQHKNKPESP